MIQPGARAPLGRRALEHLNLVASNPLHAPGLVVVAVNQDFFNGAVTGYLRVKTTNTMDPEGNFDPIVVLGPLEAASAGLTDAHGLDFCFNQEAAVLPQPLAPAGSAFSPSQLKAKGVLA